MASRRCCGGDDRAALAVSDLAVRIGAAQPVDGISFALDAGEVLGIVGESGSGKSLTLRAILRLLPRARRPSGMARWRDRNLLGMPEGEIRRIRGREIAMMFQEPMTALDPGAADRPADHRKPWRSIARCAARRRGGGRSNCWIWSAYRMPGGGWTISRMNSPAACGSAR